MLSFFLIVPWFFIFMYYESPYLFPAIASIFYAVGWADALVNFLVGYPIRPFFFTKRKELARYPKIVFAEQARAVWLLAGFFSSWLAKSQTWAMSGYSCCIATMIVSEYFGLNKEAQNKIKFWFYIFWGFLIFMNISAPISVILALVLHGCNFVVEFRLFNT